MPVFKCNGGHLACGPCVGDTPGNRCHRCEHGGGGFDHDLAMDAVMSAALVECPRDGCGSLVTYHELQDHKIACLHGPCTCMDPGCNFAGLPAAFVVHLAVAHSIIVRVLPYGKTRVSQVAVPLPASPDWLCVGQGEDSAVFVVTIGTLGPTTFVSLVCVRSAACLFPRNKVRMWARGPLGPSSEEYWRDTVIAEIQASSSTSPGAVAFEQLMSYLVVPPRYLVGAGPSNELRLYVCIEKNSCSQI